MSLRSLLLAEIPPDAAEAAWLDGLPAGTVLTASALRSFRWPIDPYDSRHWLQVSCSTQFGDEAFRAWLRRLPDEGVLIDPADPRLQRMAGPGPKSATP